MNRIEFENYITENFSAAGEQLFAKNPSYLVFRHPGCKKWFAIIMDIPRKYLGLAGEGLISIANLKCDPLLIGSFREEPGIFPAWHMNKTPLALCGAGRYCIRGIIEIPVGHEL